MSSEFTNANLAGAFLENAYVENTDFNEAIFRGAWLQGADFSRARNLSQEQIDSAFGNPKTKLPAGIRHPDHWNPEHVFSLSPTAS